MADEDLERRIARRYGELRKDEPPPELDERILAAARGAARRRSRWPLPVAAVAVLVLAVAVTYQVQREQPLEDLAVPPGVPQAKPEAPAAAREDPSPPPAAPKAVVPPEKPAAPALERRPRTSDSASRDAAPSMQSEEAREPRVGAAAPAPPAARSQALKREEPPEQWLERIIELRQQGRNDEADAALEAFRKRYPEREIPPAALRR
jgi:hypothetical protein